LDILKEKRGYWKLKEEALDQVNRELAVEDAVGLSWDRLWNGWNCVNQKNI